MRRSLYHAGTSRTVRRDNEGQDETPGRFETPGVAVNLCACAVSESSGQGANMASSRRIGRLDYLRDIHVSQRRGGVQWPNIDQNGPIIHAGMYVLRCQLDFMI